MQPGELDFGVNLAVVGGDVVVVVTLGGLGVFYAPIHTPFG